MSDQQSLKQEADPLVGQLLADRYRILAVLGRGGVGVVYKAQHAHIERLVAIKMLLAGVVDENSFLRFQQEAKAASRLSHPNVVAIHDFGMTNDGQAYLVMDYIDGKSLEDLVQQEGPLDKKRFLRIFSQVTDGMQHAHKKGIIHRDIKGSNLMLVDTEDAQDLVKIVDFGLAKLTGAETEQNLTKSGVIVGSPLFMSPEICRGHGFDHRSDIYSVGCVMYRAITGHLPVMGESVLDTMYRHISEPPLSPRAVAPKLDIPLALERTILKALEKDPGKRQQSMAELGEEIERAIIEPPFAATVQTTSLPAAAPAPPAAAPQPAQDSPSRSLSDAIKIPNYQTESTRNWLEQSVGASSMPTAATGRMRTNEAKMLTEDALTKERAKKIEQAGTVRLTLIALGATILVLAGGAFVAWHWLPGLRTMIDQTASIRKRKEAATTTAQDIPAATTAATKATAATVAAATTPVKPHAATTTAKAATTGSAAPNTAPAVSAASKPHKKPEQLPPDRNAMAAIYATEESAQAAFDSQDWARATKLYDKCLKDKEAVLGAESPLLESTLAHLIDCLNKQNQQQAAMHYLRQAETIYALNPTSVPNDLYVWSVLAKSAHAANRFDYAEQFYKLALRACANQRQRLELSVALSKVLINEHKPAEAKIILEQALRLLGNDRENKLYRPTVMEYARALRQAGDPYAAEQWMNSLGPQPFQNRMGNFRRGEFRNRFPPRRFGQPDQR